MAHILLCRLFIVVGGMKVVSSQCLQRIDFCHHGNIVATMVSGWLIAFSSSTISHICRNINFMILLINRGNGCHSSLRALSLASLFAEGTRMVSFCKRCLFGISKITDIQLHSVNTLRLIPNDDLIDHRMSPRISD